MADAAAVVGVDVGTGAARAVALARDGALLGTVAARYRGAEAWPPGRASAAAWRDALLAALSGLAAQVTAAARPAALAVGGQSPTTVDAAGGFAVTIRHPAGNDLGNADRQQAQRAVLEAEASRRVRPLQLWDWLLESLGAPPAQARWPGDPTLEGFGPRRATGEVVGHARGDGPVPRGTALVAGAQDAYLAFWAGGVDVVGRALDPGGRTGGLAVAVPESCSPAGLWTFPSAGRGVAIAGGAVNAHGLAAEWLEDLLGRPLGTLLALAAEVPPGSRGVLVLPYLEGERAPRWESRLRGLVAGLDSKVGAAELTRAVLEGTALGLAHVAEGVRAAGGRLDSLVCAGRPAASPLWCAIKGAVLGVPVEVPDDPDLAAYGAALAAGAGAGWWPRPGEGASGAWPRPPMRQVPALPATAVYAEAYRRFVSAGDIAAAHLDLFGTSPATTPVPSTPPTTRS